MKPELYGIKGPVNDAVPYHYRECGLDNIFLVNGFRREVIDGEEYVTIENLEGLWKAIGMSLIAEAKTLGPKEVRFLRGQMDMTQAELGRLLRVSSQTVARWEKGQTELPGPADFALRAAYLLSPAAQPEGCKIMERVLRHIQDLSEQDEEDPPRLNLRLNRNKWEGEACLAA